MKCKNMTYIFIFTLAITGVLFMLNSNAYAQGCSGEIVKVANPADDTPFQFNFFNGQTGQVIPMSDPSFDSIFLV